jgi:hypothetical protein
MNTCHEPPPARLGRLDERRGADSVFIGRVARMPHRAFAQYTPHGNPPAADTSTRKGIQLSATLVATILLVAAALIAIGVFVGVWLLKQPNRKAVAAGDGHAREERVRNLSRFPSPAEQAALDIVRRALALRDPADVAVFFHQGSSAAEDVIAFLENMESMDGAITGYNWLSSMDANGILIDGVLVRTMSGGSQRERLALLTPDAQGAWKIDFDAFARTVKPSWGELLGMKADQALVRVIVTGDSYYNGRFRSESEWECYGLASPDTEHILTGYCRVNTPQARAMQKILARAGETADGRGSLRRATLAIRRPVGAEDRQFEITRVLAEDWILTDKPFDGSAE